MTLILKEYIKSIKFLNVVDRIHSHNIQERLASYPTLQKAYRDGGMVTAEINAILADEFCAELLAPLYEVYEDEKARILEKDGAHAPPNRPRYTQKSVYRR